MTIPSSVDNTVSPPGGHVVQLFTQYTPYTLANGEQWTEERKEKYANQGKTSVIEKLCNENAIILYYMYIENNYNMLCSYVKKISCLWFLLYVPYLCFSV